MMLNSISVLNPYHFRLIRTRWPSPHSVCVMEKLPHYVSNSGRNLLVLNNKVRSWNQMFFFLVLYYVVCI